MKPESLIRSEPPASLEKTAEFVVELKKRDSMDKELDLTEKIIGAAIEVHNYWGLGLLESIYEKSLAHELALRGASVERQVRLDLKYKDLILDDEFVLDLVVEGKVVVELKVVKELSPIHEAQLITYMKLTGCKVGLLINFNVLKLKDGIRRVVL